MATTMPMNSGVSVSLRPTERPASPPTPSAVQTVLRPAFSRVSHRAGAIRIARPGTTSESVVARAANVAAPVRPKTAVAALNRFGQ